MTKAWAGAVAALVLLALFAGWADRRRTLRHDPDLVGLVNWPTVQLFAIAGAMVAISAALHA